MKGLRGKVKKGREKEEKRKKEREERRGSVGKMKRKFFLKGNLDKYPPITLKF